MRNEFSKKIKDIFYSSRYCMVCGHTDRPMELHHIVGRSSSSPFNCIRLCKDCHSKALHTEEKEKEFFLKTKEYLYKEKYKITSEDLYFLETFSYLVI